MAGRCRKPGVLDRGETADTEARQGHERVRQAILLARALRQRCGKGKGHRAAAACKTEGAVQERQMKVLLTRPC